MNDLTRVLDWQGSVQRITAKHPSLPGHFPGQPVVPGVVILDCVRAALAGQRPDWRIAGMPNAKFLNPLLPEQDFTVQLSGEAPRIRFKVESAGQLLAQGQLEIDT
jgi:3-hydroxymyristoyl/3-hydroxydecanoyl-(acyl carrier protein) dehydratase